MLSPSQSKTTNRGFHSPQNIPFEHQLDHAFTQDPIVGNESNMLQVKIHPIKMLQVFQQNRFSLTFFVGEQHGCNYTQDIGGLILQKFCTQLFLDLRFAFCFRVSLYIYSCSSFHCAFNEIMELNHMVLLEIFMMLVIYISTKHFRPFFGVLT